MISNNRGHRLCHDQLACDELCRKEGLRGRPRIAASRSTYGFGPQYVHAVASGRARAVVEAAVKKAIADDFALPITVHYL